MFRESQQHRVPSGNGHVRALRAWTGLAVLLFGCTRINPGFDRRPVTPPADASRDAPADMPEALPPDAPANPIVDPAMDAAIDPPGPLDPPDTAADLAAPDLAPADPWSLKVGLFGYWRFDERTGTPTATDLSGRGHHADLEALDPGTAWTMGHFGGALDFPASVTQAAARVRLPADANEIQQFTIAAWTFRTSALDGRHMSILSRQLTGPREVYNLAFFGDRLMVSVSDPGGGASFTRLESTGSPTPMNQWIHVAASYDGTTIRLYLHGREVGQAPHTGALPAASNPILIGTNRNTNNDEPMVGRLDEVLLYTRALPAGAIGALAGNERPAFP